MNTEQTTVLHISGMTCQSCEVLLERELKKLEGVRKASINHAKGKAVLYSSEAIPLSELQRVIENGEYKITKYNDEIVGQETVSTNNTAQDYVEMFAIAIILFAIYKGLEFKGLIPTGSLVSDSMSYGIILGMGVIASLSTCMAVTGGLLMAVTARHSKTHQGEAIQQKLRPQIFFNIGRVSSYAVLGGGIGLLGSVISFSTMVSGVITLIAAAAMIFLGFQILDVFPSLRKLKVPLPKGLAHKVHDMSESNSPLAPGLLGAGTFFLPCGFTQALQLYVLSTGGFMQGFVTMGLFALGTVPALFAVGTLSSISKGEVQKYTLRFAGVVAVMFGLISIPSGLTLTGLPAISFSRAAHTAQAEEVDSNVVLEKGVQKVAMKIDYIDYVPHRFTVKKGIPVEWNIDGRNAAGCMSSIVAPRLGIRDYIGRDGFKKITFTPQKTGTFPFSCSMGMGTYGAAFIVVD